MPQTKDLRLVLKREQDIEQFSTAKAKAERELGYTLRDNEFATRVLVQAVKGMVGGPSKDEIQRYIHSISGRSK